MNNKARLTKYNNPFVTFIIKHLSIVRFAFIGSINTLIDLILFGIFANILNIHPILSSVLSTGITLCFSFLMNHYFVFKSDKRKRQTAIQFVMITLLNVWVIQSSIIWLVLHAFSSIQFFDSHQWTFNMFAKLCGVSVSMILNYVGYRAIFKSESTSGS